MECMRSQEALCAHNEWTRWPGAGGEPVLVSEQWSFHCRVVCSTTNTQAWLTHLLTHRAQRGPFWPTLKTAAKNFDVEGHLDLQKSNLRGQPRSKQTKKSLNKWELTHESLKWIPTQPTYPNPKLCCRVDFAVFIRGASAASLRRQANRWATDLLW